MEEHGIKMFDMIRKIILDGQISVEDEDDLQKLLVRRSHERKCRSLSEYIQRESGKSADIKADEVRELQGRIYRYCIKGRSVGEQSVDFLAEDDIHKFIVQTAVLYEMDRKSWFVFLGMLQMALNAMSRDGVINFKVPEGMHNAFSEVAKRKRCIERPYSGDEWEKVKAWLAQNRQDIRCLALALWLEGGISVDEIGNLKKTDLVDCNGRYDDVDPSLVKRNATEDYMVLNTVRKQIILDALKLYPGSDQNYIFAVENEGRLEKLPKSSLQTKMGCICRQLGIMYKSFKNTDMVLWSLD